ncbi:class I adenylate-forming enzyme family protein [Lentzea aerocolonigenes]|uniref:class I adenylate-forming enzyme family protein n=1 Tax=Lentzea aerocolonigenes TaxID=68170 RepID=UPI0004C3EE57|nr:class I adenylate-forming enzyme family protein [Lentzea aerocolonigenes]MCP2241503.1 fatty-acyl-CoA synthase [Lentzea aerocolonigenes]
MTYVDLVLQKLSTDGDREAVIGGDTRLTRSQARDLLFRLADGLVQRGVKPGDGVAVYVGNTPEAVLLNLAVHLLGGRLVYVPPEPGPAELKALVERAEVAGVVVDPSFGEQIDGWHLQDLPGDPVERVPAPEFATVAYTGGTTGLPKLAVHRPNPLAATDPRAAMPPVTMLCNTLITHGSGSSMSKAALVTGSKLVLGPSTFDADTFVRLARDEQIAVTMFVPPMLYEVLDHPDCPGPQFGMVLVGGSPLAPRRLRQAIEKWGPVVNQGYGMTEALGIAMMPGTDIDLDRPETLRTVGRPDPAMEVEIRDGDVWVRGPFVMEGYWGEPPLSETADGWFNTGDMGYLDDDGYLYLNDRSKDVIVTGRTSDNVYSRLLDDFLVTLPGIRQAAAVGRPDEALGEVVHLFLVTDGQEDVDVDRIRDSVVAELGDLYQPRGVTIVDQLPLTKVGKVDKRKLRSQFR